MSVDRSGLRRSGLARAVMGLAFCLGSAAAANATTLSDAIRLAYQTNPDLRGERAGLRAVDEGYVQARAGLGPQVNLQGQGGYSIARVQGASGGRNADTDTTYTGATGNGGLSIVQPLFTFGAMSSRVRGARDESLAGRQSLRQAEAQVIGKVITAYMDVRRDREALIVLRDEITNLSKEFDEIKAKGELGQLTHTDIAEAQAKMLAAQAEYDLARGRVQASAADYLRVVGENPDNLEPEPELAEMPTNVDDALTAADSNSPKILEAIESEKAAREKVNEAKASYGPTLSLRVDVGVQPIVPYLPNLYDRNVTMGAVLSQPLFTSGMRASKVREASERDDQAMLNVESARREVIANVAQAWSQVLSTTAAETRTAAAVEADKVAVEGNQVEERVGRRSPFELLNTELELANTRINLIERHHDKYIAEAALLAAMGLLEARNLTPGIELYDPAKSVKEAGGMPPIPWEGPIEAVDGALSLKARAPEAVPNAGSKRPDMSVDAPATP